MPTFTNEPTPNPNSMKITTDAGPFIEEGLASLGSAAEAEGHPLGEQLFTVDGVQNVLIMPEFLTVTKGAGDAWGQVLPAVEQALGAYFEERGR